MNRRSLLAPVLAALLCLLVVVFAYRRVPDDDGGPSARRYLTVASLPLTVVHAVDLNAEQSTVRTLAPDAYIVFDKAPRNSPVGSVRLSMQPLAPLPNVKFYMYYVPAAAPSMPFDEEHKIAASMITRGQEAILTWDLPEPAALWRLDIPRDAVFKLNSVVVRGKSPLLDAAWLRDARIVAGISALASFVLILWQTFRRRVVPSGYQTKTALVLALGASLMTMALLLPPFQGPDEDAHWRLALKMYRPNIVAEPDAYYLPEMLDTGRLAFQPNEKFNPQRLRVPNPQGDVSPARMASMEAYLREQYPYVRYVSYPMIAAICWIFPPIQSLQDGLQLYYLSRLLQAALALALLGWIHRRYELPYLACFFFSLPLVVEQMTVVSPDAFLNLGTVLAVLLFLELRERPRPALTIALWLLCLTITYSKFIAGAVMILPLMLIPYRRLPHLKKLVAAAAVLALPVVFILGRVVIAGVRDVGRALKNTAGVEQQLALLGTWSGIGTFANAFVHYGSHQLNMAAWAGPLGWLDTPLGDRHLALLTLGLLLAILLDVLTYAPRLAAAVRSKPGQVAAVAAIGIGAMAFASVTDAVLFYLMTTPVGANTILGMQIRHLFPAAILALLMPMMVLPPRRQADAVAPAWSGLVPDTLAIAALPLLLLACNVELAFALFTRYWG